MEFVCFFPVQVISAFLSILQTNEARVSSSVHALHLLFGTTCKTHLLLPTDRLVWNDMVHDIISSITFKTKVMELKYNAAAAQEFTVITHDETFKTLFSLIGQKKMTQNKGELHALHTFRGLTGCTVGVLAWHRDQLVNNVSLKLLEQSLTSIYLTRFGSFFPIPLCES